jgi:glycosyltransferase involved in cell wall biosynthesis
VVSGTLSSAIDTDACFPVTDRVVRGRIGFAGRLSDPRKNVGLFLHTVALLRQRGHAVSAVLLGGSLAPEDAITVRRLGLADIVTIAGHVERDALPAFLQALDVFVVPSKQEGLCIAALEAMAAGCPVVSTHCGGPEEFVIDGRTGYLVGGDALALAGAVERIVEDRGLRERLSVGARQLAIERYGGGVVRDVFWRWFDAAFQVRSDRGLA